MTEPILTVDSLSIGYQTQNGLLKAVRDLSLTLMPGETLGIVGESGCGKSATALALMGLLPSPQGQIISGKILFEGEDLATLSKKAWRKVRGKKLAMIFQDPMTSLNPTMSIGKQLSETLILHEHLTTHEANKRAIELLHLVEITTPERRLRQYPHELSGGMRQRIMIAMALACHPKVLIADEPTTALDVTVQANILDLLKDLQRRFQMSILLISHDFGVIQQLCDRVAVMYAGELMEINDTKTLVHDPKHPYTKALIAAMPTLDMNPNDPVFGLEGVPPKLISPPKGCPFAPRCPKAMRICVAKKPPLFVPSPSGNVACWLEAPHE